MFASDSTIAPNAIYTVTFCTVSQPLNGHSNKKMIYYCLLKQRSLSFPEVSKSDDIWILYIYPLYILNFYISLSVLLACAIEQGHIKCFCYCQDRKGHHFWLKPGILTVLLQVTQQCIGGAQPFLYKGISFQGHLKHAEKRLCYLWHKKLLCF